MRPIILVVDDEPLLLELFREVLSADYEVLIAKRVYEAVELLQARAVRAVITDLNCGTDNGLDLLRWINEYRPELLATTFLLSGEVEPDTEGFAVPVISKPIDLIQLKSTFAGIFAESEMPAG